MNNFIKNYPGIFYILISPVYLILFILGWILFIGMCIIGNRKFVSREEEMTNLEIKNRKGGIK